MNNMNSTYQHKVLMRLYYFFFICRFVGLYEFVLLNIDIEYNPINLLFKISFLTAYYTLLEKYYHRGMFYFKLWSSEGSA